MNAFQLATYRSCIKHLKIIYEIAFYCIWWLKFCNLYMKFSFPEVLYKYGFLRNFSKFTDKHNKQSSGWVKSKDVFKIFAKFTENNFVGVSF